MALDIYRQTCCRGERARDSARILFKNSSHTTREFVRACFDARWSNRATGRIEPRLHRYVAVC